MRRGLRSESGRVSGGLPGDHQHQVGGENRPQLQAALNALVEGDDLVVAKLDRLGRDQSSVITASTTSRNEASTP